MKRSEFDHLIFVGFNSRVIAIDRETGDALWYWKAPKGYDGYVAVMLDGNMLIVSVQGYMYALDPTTGATLWSNPLKGMGIGTPSIASVRGSTHGGGASSVKKHHAAMHTTTTGVH